MNNYITLYEKTLSSKAFQNLIDKFEPYTYLYEKEHITVKRILKKGKQFIIFSLFDENLLKNSARFYNVSDTNSPTQTPTIEARFEALLKEHANETLSEALLTKSIIPTNQVDYYNAYYQREFINRYEGAFALQSAFELDGAYCQEHFYTSKDSLWHVAVNNIDFKLKREVV